MRPQFGTPVTAASTSSLYPPTEPLQVIKARPSWAESFASLRVANFRLFTISNIVSMSGTWMQRIAQDWLVLELSHSVAAVGVTVAAQFLPMLTFGLYGGLIVDRYSKRMLLMITQTTFGILGLVLATLAFTHTVQVWHVYLLAFIGGFVVIVDNPTRQVFVNELVGPRNLRNAIAINSSVFQLGGLIGPAIAGVLLDAVGAGWVFAINGLSCFGVLFALAILKTSKLVRSPQVGREKGQLAQGLRYVASKPAIFWSIVMVAVTSVFALTMPVILAAYANNVFRIGASGYGLLNTVVAAGALTGGILATRRRVVRLRTVVVMGALWGVFAVAASVMPTELSLAVLLIGVGLFNLLFITAANAVVQMSSNLGIRGRVMSFYVLVLLGGQAIGGPLMGWIVANWGPHVGIAVAGGVPALAAILIGIHLARRHELRISVWLAGRAPRMAIVHRMPNPTGTAGLARPS
jgi:MFS family permease